jgi:peptidoglycan/xylan/chitin deacetylase (PgdA/CDA1 family)
MPSIRADRLMTLGLMAPLRRVGLGGSITGRMPVLMYHAISGDDSTAQSAYYKVTTRPEVFGLHMRLLHEGGYQVVGIEKGLDIFRQHGIKTRKLVVLTFDDGFRDFYTQALPVLGKYGFGATMYVPTSFIGESPLNFRGKDCMTWAEVRECRKAGIEFGSHTVTHPKLYELSEENIRRELEESKSELEIKLGEPVNSFAYPFAFPGGDAGFVTRFKSLLRAAGYHSNVTTRLGRVRPGDCPFTLRRLPVNSEDDAALFMAKIQGSYDWLTLPQDIFKGIKKLVSGTRNRTGNRTGNQTSNSNSRPTAAPPSQRGKLELE